jgi:polyferredoxin
MVKLVSNLLFVLMFWAQLFVVAYEFLGLTWACAAMLPFTFLGWAWCTPLDKKHATPTETIGPDYVAMVEAGKLTEEQIREYESQPNGDPENN